MRNISALPPRYGAINARSLNAILGTGREKRAKRMPVIKAMLSSPANASRVIRTCAVSVCGAMFPYPIVPNVSMLKKNARPNRPPGAGPVSASGPASRKAPANRTFSDT